MAKEVIIQNDLPFILGYKERIDTLRNEYQKWIFENLGYVAEVECGFTVFGKNVHFKFIFKTDEDATAFKLRWS